jgi:hypothetical protein
VPVEIFLLRYCNYFSSCAVSTLESSGMARNEKFLYQRELLVSLPGLISRTVHLRGKAKILILLTIYPSYGLISRPRSLLARYGQRIPRGNVSMWTTILLRTHW